MTIFKRNGVYYVESKRVGRKRVCTSTGARTLKEARKFADGLDLATRCPTFDLAVEFLRRYYDNNEGRTYLKEAWERYEGIAKSVGKDNVAEKTMRLRRERLAKFVAWCATAHQRIQTVEEVTGVVATEYATLLAEDGLKTKTRKCILCDLSTVWSLLAKSSANLANPWKGLAPRITDSVRGEAFTDEQADAVVAAAERVGKGWRLACIVARYTGFRYGDVANLEWSEVRLDEGVIRSDPNKTIRFGISVVTPLHPVLADALREARKSALDAPEGTAARQFVLPRHAVLYGDSKRWKEGLDFADVLKEAKLEGRFTFQSWRHYFRTKLGEAKVKTEVAMGLCGHTNARTSKHYDHAEHIDELRAAIASAFPSASATA